MTNEITISKQPVVVHWMRRDLRLHDNHALYHALRSDFPVLIVFIFDTSILSQLDNKRDRRVNFIYNEVNSIKKQLEVQGSSLLAFYGKPLKVFELLSDRYDIRKVYANDDYEPYAKDRDEAVRSFLHQRNTDFQLYKDHVIFEKEEVMKGNGEPYTVFTPYSKKWKALYVENGIKSYPSETLQENFIKTTPFPFPSISDTGFIETDPEVTPPRLDAQFISSYGKTRDYPGIEGTSRISVHIRFGTISIRHLVAIAYNYSETYLNELIWREFYQMILWNFPHVGKGFAFKPAYDNIPWRNREDEFEKWCAGQTGYPLVDAGMRELKSTGFMHNRVRMITASFLCKHLLIDWRWGEAWFAEHLLDYELASNNGGWQWASGSGCDAAPYFRIFNPYIQQKKFDPDQIYINKWGPHYPPPMVDHDLARKRCLETYKNALQDL